MKRGYMQISFSLLFGVAAGIVILILAVYAATKIINTGQQAVGAKTGKEIGILLNPLETSFESGQTTPMTLPTLTRIYNKCYSDGVFGSQGISTTEKSFGKWTETDLIVEFENKYVFSEEYVEGKNFYIFSKPFEFPFKVADLIYLTSASETYCFKDAPEDIEEELDFLRQGNIKLENCSEREIIVCFNSEPNCDVEVNYELGKVNKNEGGVFFEGDALMYAAIFSNKDIYECQLKRLMKRVEQLSLLYIEKAELISPKSCDSNLNLIGLKSATSSLTSSSSIDSVGEIAEKIKQDNDYSNCKLW